MAEIKDYLTVRIGPQLKSQIFEAAEKEHRSLSNLGRLLLEYAFEQYRKAGSLHDLLDSQEEFSFKER